MATNNFTKIVIVSSAAECAHNCFHRKCIVAGYIPISATAGNCMLSFDDDDVDDGDGDCTQSDSNRTTNYTENEPILLTCLLCGTFICFTLFVVITRSCLQFTLHRNFRCIFLIL